MTCCWLGDMLLQWFESCDIPACHVPKRKGIGKGNCYQQFPFFSFPCLYLSELPEAKRYSLGWNSTTLPGPECPINWNITVPAIRSHSFTVWSSSAEANHLPSGLNRRHLTAVSTHCLCVTLILEDTAFSSYIPELNGCIQRARCHRTSTRMEIKAADVCLVTK